MHAALKLFEVFAPQGQAAELQPRKIAFKLSVKDGSQTGDNAIDFNKILESLTPKDAGPVAQGQLEASLESLDWLPLDQSQLDQSTPMIDLTDPDADNEEALELLMAMAFKMMGLDATAEVTGTETPDTLSVMDLAEQSIQEVALPDNPRNQDQEGALLQTGQPAETEDPLVQSLELEQAGRFAKGTGNDFEAALADGEAHEAPGDAPDLTPKLAARQPEQQETSAAGEGDKTVSNLTKNEKESGVHRPVPADRLPFEVKPSGQHPGKPLPDVGQEATSTPDPKPDAGDSTSKSLSRPEMNQNLTGAETTVGQEDGPGSEKGREVPQIRGAAQSTGHTPSVAHAKASETAAPLPQDVQTDVIRQIVERMTVRSDRGQSEMQIKLKPEFLGDLRLHVSTENQHVMVRITADSPAVKEMIEHNLPMLKTELQHHGLQIHKFDVFVGQDQDAWKHRQQQNASHDARRGRQRFAGQRKLRSLEGSEPSQDTGLWRRPNPHGMKEVDFFA